MKRLQIVALILTLVTSTLSFTPATIYPDEQKTRRHFPIRRLQGYAELKKEAEAERQAVESGRLAASTEQQAALAPAPRAPRVLKGFAGLDFNSSGGSVPPDTIAATGPDHIIELINSAIAIYNRSTGAKISEQPLVDFFGATAISDCIFDPVVGYDEIAGRFYIGALEIPELCGELPAATANLLYAVSDSPDPTDGFTAKYQINVTETSNSECPASTPVGGDFTRTGWNFDVHVFTFNMFDFAGTCYDHVSVITIDKSSIDTGPLVFTHADFDGSGHFTLVPAVMHGAITGDPMWFVEEASFFDRSQLRVVKMTDVLSNPPTFTSTEITVASYGFPPAATQKGGGKFIETNDTRILNVEWRDDRLVASQTVGLSGAARARWYEFDTTDLSAPTQQGTIDQGLGIHTYYPSIAIAENGDLGMTFMQSSSSQFMSMYVTGQLAGAAAGSMQTPILAKAGTRNYIAFDCDQNQIGETNVCRAGDYSGITIDPTVPDRFCAANEYATSAAPSSSSANWGTWISCFTLTPVHDLALTALIAPKTIAGTAPVNGAVTVTIQNRSDHNETISSADLGDGSTTGVARLSVAVVDVDETCQPAGIALNGLKNAILFSNGPKVLKPKGTLTVNFTVTYQCPGALPKTNTAGDYSHTATVHHDALSGAIADTHTEDDVCPRAPLGFDPNPAPKGVTDNGCGAKTPFGTLGNPVVTNVVR